MANHYKSTQNENNIDNNVVAEEVVVANDIKQTDNMVSYKETYICKVTQQNL